jgi:hypothetical protein
MLKKISLSLIAALLLSVALVGTVAAQPDAPPYAAGFRTGENRAVVGQITAIGASSFTMEVRGKEVTILVASDTVFGNRDGTSATFADLEIGRWVAGTATQNDDGDLVARRVILLPEDFDPVNINLSKMGGEVDKINNGQNTFTITTRDGQTVTIHVDGRTRWLGSLTELKDLEKGMKVGVAAQEQEDGSLLAKGVTTGSNQRELKRAVGKVTSIGTNSLTIHNRNGDMTFAVTSDTRFESQSGDVHSLDDLEVGQGVLVIYNAKDSSQTALAIVVGSGEGQRVIGTVQSAGGSHLTIQTNGGEKMSFAVDGKTVIKSRDGSVIELNDLKNGTKVIVAYVTQNDGTLLARLILAGKIDSTPPDKPNGPH